MEMIYLIFRIHLQRIWLGQLIKIQLSILQTCSFGDKTFADITTENEKKTRSLDVKKGIIYAPVSPKD